jgi:two-component system, NarL family, response regulator DesR
MPEHVTPPVASGDRPALTATQLAVLRLAADGLSSGEIATQLGTTPEAIRAQLVLAICALGAESKLQAISLAARAGWLDLATRTTPPARSQAIS